ncbi:MAG: (E)-4-hydroxy-3-methylbut-2-enyl-diphosphate synthase [Bacteroidales bacterium]|nr:(E)-4-hydroxy-3-methylbut-2-enyl-diphosphate synthase [Bacteroidales bacterium]
MKYNIDLANYERFPTREVKIGDLALGSNNEIRLQSMTNTPSLDTKATVAQVKRIFDAGADYVRITSPSIAEAENLAEIKRLLKADSYSKPLIADVHFNPKIAETAARIVEKVRINPGNYVDKKSNSTNKIISEIEYAEELEIIHERLLPLISICKEYGTAIRIGSNHGSLSDRIVQRYGNTVEGMVEAAMEYINMFVAESFYNLVISMKASDVSTTVGASRLLNAKMLEKAWNFPQHLGVTEAGEGEDGRMKSALGIGSLLNDGIGDTIRVSLTEAPEKEIEFAKKLVANFSERKTKIFTLPIHRPTYSVFHANTLNPLSNKFSQKCMLMVNAKDMQAVSQKLVPEIDMIVQSDMSYSDKIYINHIENQELIAAHKLVKAEDILSQEKPKLSITDDNFMIEFSLGDAKKLFPFLKKHQKNVCLLFNAVTEYPIGEVRALYKMFKEENLKIPLFLKYTLDSSLQENNIIDSAIYPGSALIDRIADGIMPVYIPPAKPDFEMLFSMLQSLGLRYTNAEFISCPACGRTNYDIETIAKQVKLKLSHLKGLKIAIMGCVVNGPGEMSDADYGYVGAQNGKVNLYKGQKLMRKSIPENKAIDELIGLIKENNDWIEPNFEI